LNKLSAFAIALFASTTIGTAWADQDDRKLDHVFVIMMENHGYKEIIGSPYMPFTNKEAAQANSAKNYFAVAHPSLTNYLEVVGGSNFRHPQRQEPELGQHQLHLNPARRAQQRE
jgi:phosphatidylinositol-3-phosphatase